MQAAPGKHLQRTAVFRIGTVKSAMTHTQIIADNVAACLFNKIDEGGLAEHAARDKYLRKVGAIV